MNQRVVRRADQTDVQWTVRTAIAHMVQVVDIEQMVSQVRRVGIHDGAPVDLAAVIPRGQHEPSKRRIPFELSVDRAPLGWSPAEALDLRKAEDDCLVLDGALVRRGGCRSRCNADHVSCSDLMDDGVDRLSPGDPRFDPPNDGTPADIRILRVPMEAASDALAVGEYDHTVSVDRR